jgi:hypothetical protein
MTVVATMRAELSPRTAGPCSFRRARPVGQGGSRAGSPLVPDWSSWTNLGLPRRLGAYHARSVEVAEGFTVR